MDNKEKADAFKQAKEIKTQNIESLKKVSETYTNCKHMIEQYNQSLKKNAN